MRAVIFGEEMIIWLVLVRSHLFRDGLIPFVSVGEDRVHVKNDTVKVKQPVSNNLADLIFGMPHFYCRWCDVGRLWQYFLELSCRLDRIRHYRRRGLGLTVG